MANIKWCETAGEDDCLSNVEWNKMVTYIKHSSVTDFTIYSTEGTCVDTGQAFKFSQAGVLSQMWGGADTGDLTQIWANSTDAEPSFLMKGDDYAELDVASYFMLRDQGTQSFKFEYTANVSKISGGSANGDDLVLWANTNNNCAVLELLGNAGIVAKIKATSTFEVSTCSDETLFEIDSASGDHHFDFHCLDADNFVLENRTNDPVSPCIGQIWFRTDLV